MHDFIYTIQRRLIDAAVPAITVMAVGGVILALLYWTWYGKSVSLFPEEKGITKRQIAATLLLLCYLGGLAAVTLGLRQVNDFQMGIQTRPFLAFAEAWNAFTLQVWLNPLLNIAMFIPLGVLLPLAARPFRRWYWTLTVGLGTSLLVETFQYLLKRGQADIDDLICNTLGALLGYCLCMTVVNLAARIWKTAGAYAALPILSAAVLAGTFLAYQLMPYGNLADAPIFAADTSGTNWVLDTELSDQPGPTGVYWAEPFTKGSGDEFARDFAKRRGVDLESGNFDIIYYDNSAFYSDHHTFMLWLNYNDHSYEYNDYRVDSWGEENWGEASETELRDYLNSLGITVPDAAEFLDDGNGKYVFNASCVMENGFLTDGELSCRVAQDGQVYEVRSTLSVCVLHSEAPVISEQEAYRRLCAGRFNQSEAFAFDYNAPHAEVHVTACTLEYLVDSKGFRQPVYYFTLSDKQDMELRGGNGWRVFVPALA